MFGELIVRQFEAIGARALVRPDGAEGSGRVRLDVRRDARGEYFDIAMSEQSNLRVVDAMPRMRHLLLMNVDPASGERHRFLCGHDERHWFVASVPGRSVSNVRTAAESLKPAAVLLEQEGRGGRGRDGVSRRTEAIVRQGEWFFVPRPNPVVDRHSNLTRAPQRPRDHPARVLARGVHEHRRPGAGRAAGRVPGLRTP